MGTIINRYDAERIGRTFPGAQLRSLEKGEDYKPGHIYMCGYWHKFFKVLDVQHGAPVWGTVYTVRWEDGSEARHSTRPDRKFDYEIVM